ncbi:MAG: Uma2 family endonuclease [Verrucomicrobia bacterium]|nr:Uma2 family endonuclease [Leptolyngbya sp. ES-bin-22]
MTTFIPGDSSIARPPTQADLPCDDGEPMETQRHKVQMELLIDALLPWLDARDHGYVGGNMFVYYSLAQVRNQDFKGPDFFAVLDVPKGERRSWVSWEEGKTPDVVIELLSESTATADKGEKKRIYQTQMHVPEYFWYDPFNPNDWAGFQLQGGGYQAILPNEQGHLVSQMLGLALMRWQGDYKGIEALWLRWVQRDGTLLLTSAEQENQRAERENQRAEQERQRADRAESQVAQIARNLLQTGMTAAQVMQITGLSREQLETIAQSP